MKIALVGTRGIPARYGGFETCAEELGAGLAARGHRALVSCRRNLYPGKPRRYRNVELCYPPAIRGKITDTFSHTFFAVWHAILWNPDVIMIFNTANSPLAVFPRIYGKKVVINVDGLEWKRKKWGRAAKTYYRFAEWLSCLTGNRLIADSRVIQKYYAAKFGRTTDFISYGAYLHEDKNSDLLKEYGLERKNYFFMGSRLEPENNHDLVIRAFLMTDTDKLLAIAGGIPYRSNYARELMTIKNRKIRFLGPVYQPGYYNQLQAYARAYIHGNEVGGTNPSLLSAMGAGACILSLDTPFNREVLGDAGLFFRKDPGDLARRIEDIATNPEKTEEYGRKARERASAIYTWPKVVEAYEKLFMALAGKMDSRLISPRLRSGQAAGMTPERIT